MNGRLPEKFRRCSHGQGIPETKERAESSQFKEKEKVEGKADLLPLYGNLVWFAVRIIPSSTFYFFLCYSWRQLAESAKGPPREYFGIKIGCQSEFCANLNMCSFSSLHRQKFLKFSRNKDSWKNVLCYTLTLQQTLILWTSKNYKILTTRVQYFIN